MGTTTIDTVRSTDTGIKVSSFSDESVQITLPKVGDGVIWGDLSDYLKNLPPGTKLLIDSRHVVLSDDLPIGILLDCAKTKEIFLVVTKV